MAISKEHYAEFQRRYHKYKPETPEEFRFHGDYFISWPEQRIPHKSTNPIMRVLDWLHQRDGQAPSCYLTLIRAYVYIPLAVIMVIGIAFTDRYDLIGYPVYLVFYAIFMNGIGLTELYRYLRNRYFKLHDLPGPYGWGTLDKQNYLFYVNRVTGFEG